jgi:hypothetical protein
MSERSVSGTPFSGAGRPSRSFAKGRVCKEQGCDTILSMYNQDKFCAQHAPLTVPRTRGRKIA